MEWSSDDDDPLPSLSDEEVDQATLVAIACEERDQMDPVALAARAKEARAHALGLGESGGQPEPEPEAETRSSSVSETRLAEAEAKASARRATWLETEGGVQSKLDVEFKKAKDGVAANKSEIMQRMEVRQQARTAEREARIQSITLGADSLMASLSAEIDAELGLSGEGARTAASFEKERARYQRHLADFTNEIAPSSASATLDARRVIAMDARAKDRRMASLGAAARGEQPLDLRALSRRLG